MSDKNSAPEVRLTPITPQSGATSAPVTTEGSGAELKAGVLRAGWFDEAGNPVCWGFGGFAIPRTATDLDEGAVVCGWSLTELRAVYEDAQA